MSGQAVTALMADEPPSSEQRPRLRLAHILLWITAAACLLSYFQTMPSGTIAPDRSPSSLVFLFFSAALGGMAVTGFFWLLPSAVRGQLAYRDPGELLLMGIGAIVIMGWILLAWTAAKYETGTPEHYRMYVVIYGLIAAALHSIMALVHRRSLIWRIALGAFAVPYLLWALVNLLAPQAGLSYFWYGERSTIVYAQFFCPFVAAVPFVWAVVTDLRARQRTAAHWLGVFLFLILLAKSLHYVEWHRLLGLLAPQT